MKPDPNIAERYLRTIRNSAKRIYAIRYWQYLNGYRAEEPSHGLSYMAAQAVRMRLNEIYRETSD